MIKLAGNNIRLVKGDRSCYRYSPDILHDRTILINEEYADDSYGKQTLLHELLHACFESGGLCDYMSSQLEVDCDESYKVEEFIVQRLEKQLLALFKQNPALLDQIFGDTPIKFDKGKKLE